MPIKKKEGFLEVGLAFDRSSLVTNTQETKLQNKTNVNKVENNVNKLDSELENDETTSSENALDFSTCKITVKGVRFANNVSVKSFKRMEPPRAVARTKEYSEKLVLRKKIEKKNSTIETKETPNVDLELEDVENDNSDKEKPSIYTLNNVYIKNNAIEFINKWAPGKIPYINIKIGESNEDSVHCEAMCDSGASHTYISFNILEQVTNYTKYVTGVKNISIGLGKGTLEAKNASFAMIPLRMVDSNGKTHVIRKKVIALKELSENMFIGSDFLYDKKRVDNMTTEGIRLNIGAENEEKPLIPYLWRKTQTSINLLLEEELVLAPREMRKVTAISEIRPKHKGIFMVHDTVIPNSNLEASEVAAEAARASAEHNELLEVQMAIVDKSENDHYEVLVYNHSDEYPLRFDEGYAIALLTQGFDRHGFHTVDLKEVELEDGSIELDYENMKLNRIALDDDLNINKAEKVVEPNADNLDHTLGVSLEEIKANVAKQVKERAIRDAKEKLDNVTNITEEERKQLLEQFKQNGYVELPASAVINDSGHVTEFQNLDDNQKTEEEILSEIKVGHLNEKDRKKVLDLCKEYIYIFTKSEMDIEINTLGVEADCVLKSTYDTNKTSNAKLRPYPAQTRQIIQDILDKMERNNLIADCDSYSPIVSQLLIQRKKGTLKPRIILDLRATNAACLKLPAQLPTTQEIFALFAGKQFVTALDVANFYFTIPMKPEKQSLFCFFDTRNKRKKLLVMPQGFRNASSYAAQLTGRLLEGLNDYHAAFVDDIWVATPSKPSYDEGVDFHIKQLRELFDRLAKAHLKIKPAKFEPMKDGIEILGYLYEAGRFSIPKHRILGIKQIPRPKTIKQAKSFLALVNYFRMFIFNFAFLTCPILELMKGNAKKLVWNEAAETAFKMIKQKVEESIQISAPDFSKEFKMSVDASLLAHGSILWQVDENDKPVYLGCTSKVFIASDRNQSAFFRELIALTSSLLHYNFYLEFAKEITVYTDALSILWLKAIRQGLGRLFRFAMILSTYELVIKHIPSNKQNWLPDILSRAVDVEKLAVDRSMTIKQADKLFELLTLPDGYTISKETLKMYLESNGLKDPYAKSPKKSKAKVEITPDSLKPLNMPKKKETLPVSTKYHPFYPEQQRQRDENKVDFKEPGKDSIRRKVDFAMKSMLMKKPKYIHCWLANAAVKHPWTLPPVDENCEGTWMEEKTPVEEKNVIPQLTAEEVFDDLHSCVLHNLGIRKAKESNHMYICEDIVECTLATIRVRNGYKAEAGDPKGDPEPESSENKKVGGEFENAFIDSFLLNNKIIGAGKITLEILREAQKKCAHVQHIARQDPLPKNYFYRANILLHQRKGIKGSERIVLPKNLMEPIIHHMHFSIYNLHMVPSKIYDILSKTYYAENLKQWIEETLPNCAFCILQLPNRGKHVKIGTVKLPEMPRQRWNLDLVFGFPHINGYNGIAVFVDAFSLYVIARPIRSKNADEILKIFKEDVYGDFDCMELFSDGEKAVSSQKFDDFCTDRGIVQHKTAASSPWQNAAAENTINLLKTQLRIYRQSTDRTWVDLLPDINRSLNDRKLRVGYTPSEIMFIGKLPKEDLLEEQVILGDFESYMDYMKAYGKKVRETHIARRKRKNESVRNTRNKARVEKEFEVGDIVYAKDVNIAQVVGKSTKATYKGPFEIIEIREREATCLLEDMETHRQRIVHLNYLRKSTNTPNLKSPAKSDVSKVLSNNQEIEQNERSLANDQESVEARPNLRRSARIEGKRTEQEISGS